MPATTDTEGTPAMGSTAKVATLPGCDIPACTRTAVYDAKTKVAGRWAFLCEPHYQMYRAHTDLGTGKGQRLTTEGN